MPQDSCQERTAALNSLFVNAHKKAVALEPGVHHEGLRPAACMACFCAELSSLLRRAGEDIV
jgi:hypothetical protein